MSWKEEVRKAIKTVGQNTNEINCIVCTVDSVDLTKKSCYCLPIDTSKADLQDVRLIADNKVGFMIVPKVGSIVVVSYITNELTYISMFSSVDKILLNGEAYDGLVRVVELTTKLNNLETAFNNHLLLYNLHVHAGVTVGTGATGIAAPDTQVLVKTIKTELENTTVKHGNGT